MYVLKKVDGFSAYEMKLSACCHIASCIYILICSYDVLRNRTIIIKYFNAIGSQYKKPIRSIHRAIVYTRFMMYGITVIIAYSMMFDITIMLIMLVTWAPYVNLIPSALDYQYHTLVEQLIHSYRSIARDIRHVIRTNTAPVNAPVPYVLKHNNAESSENCNLQQCGPKRKDGDHSIHCVLLKSRFNDDTLEHVLSRVKNIMKLASIFTKVIGRITRITVCVL